MIILILLILHWYLVAWTTGIFVHRYTVHKQFTFKKNWDKVFYIFTYIVHGASFISPKVYKELHKNHHRYADTQKDPHSPIFSGNILKLFCLTALKYFKLKIKHFRPKQNYLEIISESLIARSLWILIYVHVYLNLSTSLYLLFLLPLHILMMPIQGAIINWFGHKVGYRNFNELKDNSKNTFKIDLVLLGELMQNNHHKFPRDSNFAKKKNELDIIYSSLKILEKLSIIEFRKKPNYDSKSENLNFSTHN